MHIFQRSNILIYKISHKSKNIWFFKTKFSLKCSFKDNIKLHFELFPPLKHGDYVHFTTRRIKEVSICQYLDTDSQIFKSSISRRIKYTIKNICLTKSQTKCLILIQNDLKIWTIHKSYMVKTDFVQTKHTFNTEQTK